MIATQHQHTPRDAGDCRLCGVPHARGQAASAADDGGEGHGPALSPATASPAPQPFLADLHDFQSDPRVEYPAIWAAKIVCADLDCRHHTEAILADLRRAMSADGPCAGRAADALLLFHAAIELAVRAGSLHAHLAAKSCCTECDPRVARFLSTAQSTALPPDPSRDPSVRSDGAPLSS